MKHLAKYPLHVEAYPYMLRKNEDRLSIGGVRLIWWGTVPFAVPCMAGIEYRRKMKKDGTIADSIPG